ncbi:hypothetical protein IMSAGC022_00005 [Alistipes sp.]|nr:hypothetical protein IMSAGC022_00005 [Alistipes sp.]
MFIDYIRGIVITIESNILYVCSRQIIFRILSKQKNCSICWAILCNAV